MDGRVTPPQRVTLPTWGSPPLCKQDLRFDQISPRSRKISQSSWRDLFYLAQNVFHLGEISSRSQRNYKSHRDHLSSRASLGEISSVSRPRSLSSRADLRDITNLAEFLTRSRRDLIYLAATLETLQVQPSSRRDFVNLDEITFLLARSRRDLRDIANLAEISSRLITRSRRDLCHLGEISHISRRSRLDLSESSFISPISLRQYKSRRDLGQISRR